MYADEIAKADDSVALINEKAAAYRETAVQRTCSGKERICRRYHRGHADTRKRVIAAFEMLFTKERGSSGLEKHGTV